MEDAVELEAMRNKKLGIDLAGPYRSEQHWRADGVHQPCGYRDVAIPQALQMEINFGSMHANVGNGAARGYDSFAELEACRDADRLDRGVDATLVSHSHDRLDGVAIDAVDDRR